MAEIGPGASQALGAATPAGQVFTPTANITVSRIGFYLYGSPADAPFTGGLVLNSTDIMSALWINGISATKNLTGPGWHYFDLPTPVALTSGTAYVALLTGSTQFIGDTPSAATVVSGPITVGAFRYGGSASNGFSTPIKLYYATT